MSELIMFVVPKNVAKIRKIFDSNASEYKKCNEKGHIFDLGKQNVVKTGTSFGSTEFTEVKQTCLRATIVVHAIQKTRGTKEKWEGAAKKLP